MNRIDEKETVIMGAFKELLQIMSPDCGVTAVRYWRDLYEEAKSRAVHYSILRKVNSLPADARPPQDVLNIWKVEYLKYSAFVSRRTKAVCELLKAMSEEGIKVVLLKGAVLAEELYHQPSDRYMNDVDFYVDKSDAEKAIKIFDGFEYIRTGGYCSEHKHLGFVRQGIYIELHWRLADSMRIYNNDEIDKMVGRIVPFNYNGQPAYKLCDTDMLLYLIIHIYQHHFAAGFKGYYDIALLLNRFGDKYDWEEIWSRAESLNIVSAACLVLLAAADMFGLDYPPQLQERITWQAGIEKAQKWLMSALKAHTSNKIVLIKDWLNKEDYTFRQRREFYIKHITAPVGNKKLKIILPLIYLFRILRSVWWWLPLSGYFQQINQKVFRFDKYYIPKYEKVYQWANKK